jgi:hypothetical protein
MAEVYGINNIKLLIVLLIELGNIGDAIGRENSSNWKKWLKLLDALPEAVDILKVDWSFLKNEYNDLSDIERAEIKEYIVQKFSIENKNLEGVIEESFSIFMSIGDNIKRSIELFRNLKKA